MVFSLLKVNRLRAELSREQMRQGLNICTGGRKSEVGTHRAGKD